MNLFASLASFEIVQTCNLLLTFTGLLDRNLHTKLTECRCLAGGALLCCTICVHIACITHGAMEEGREGRDHQELLLLPTLSQLGHLDSNMGIKDQTTILILTVR